MRFFSLRTLGAVFACGLLVLLAVQSWRGRVAPDKMSELLFQPDDVTAMRAIFREEGIAFDVPQEHIPAILASLRPQRVSKDGAPGETIAELEIDGGQDQSLLLILHQQDGRVGVDLLGEQTREELSYDSGAYAGGNLARLESALAAAREDAKAESAAIATPELALLYHPERVERLSVNYSSRKEDVTFDVPTEHIAPILRALLPARVNQGQFSKCTAFGTFDLEDTDGEKIHIFMHGEQGGIGIKVSGGEILIGGNFHRLIPAVEAAQKAASGVDKPHYWSRK
jgi:hypothetical protein